MAQHGARPGRELPRGDNPVLASRQRRHTLIDDFQTCEVWKSSFGLHGASVAGEFVCVTPRL
jgi:hypothetical protein